jgi:hypothetical protein
VLLHGRNTLASLERWLGKREVLLGHSDEFPGSKKKRRKKKHGKT